ncbi:membrane protein insertase YidC [Aquimarina sp. AD1]|uniref:membrane protein insertase YidC n=1 Tax=Aquimarina sp. (strain AD1) TaxID=1714848 RepID=UPI000E488566|nr:membrane protein insertase YidC [Aquimarina sp. AD1]AXT58559.1 membrane protein insertase YidC [Aquimarina sp. AD1]RKN24343.1 membrane protein insertase YidC [Aquimarina sp. AD1]
MEEKKFDLNTVIGFVLIFGIFAWMFWVNKPTPEEIEAQKAEQEQVEAQEKTQDNKTTDFVKESEAIVANPQDSLAVVAAKSQLGAFAYSASLPSAKENVTKIENEVLTLKINNRGGYIQEALLKNFKTYDSVPLYLIKDGKNASFNLNFGTTDNRILNTKDLFFEPTVTKNGDNTVLSMKLKVSDSKFLEYRYELKPNDYMLDFSIKSQGLQQVFNSSQVVNLDWKLQAIRQAKSASYENRYTEILYEYDGGKDDYTGQGDFAEDTEEEVTWVGFKQHFFTSVLLTDTPFKTATFASKNVANTSELDDKDIKVTKEFAASMPLELKGGELNYNMNWYYGPTDYKILSSYDRNLDEIVPLGWGIFGVINRYIFIPFFGFLSGFLPYGIAIVVMTIVVRIVLSPVTYKSYVSQAKMKILKPEITEINEKYKDNAMKKQQETMALYSKAGASPMSGCLPALMQIPVFYALFNFFPSAFDLRQKSFLWADDLSSYDTIAKLPFEIPFYGDHISLFPILASIAIFIYMMMTTGQTMQQQQPGMPNMKFIMYLSPLMMLIFFNNYASGLSLYYFISNLITIGIMLVIKNVIIDEDKIHAKIQENKKKPKKQGKFQKKMKELMEQAEQQKASKK